MNIQKYHFFWAALSKQYHVWYLLQLLLLPMQCYLGNGLRLISIYKVHVNMYLGYLSCLRYIPVKMKLIFQMFGYHHHVSNHISRCVIIHKNNPLLLVMATNLFLQPFPADIPTPFLNKITRQRNISRIGLIMQILLDRGNSIALYK